MFNRSAEVTGDFDAYDGLFFDDFARVRFRGRTFVDMEKLDFSYTGKNRAWADYDDDDEAWYDEYGVGTDETCVSGQSLNQRPVEVVSPPASCSDSTLKTPEPNSQEEGSDLTGSPVTVMEDSSPPVKLSKGQRMRRNRKLRKSAAISGRRETQNPVPPPCPSMPEVTTTPQTRTQSMSTGPSLNCCCPVDTHPPLSREDLTRIRHLLAFSEGKGFAPSAKSRTRAEWRELWITSPWIPLQESLFTN
nr:MAG: hypothetical protein 1 [Barnaviridae sp.]